MTNWLPALRGPFWTVEIDRGREKEPSYILSSGEVDRPEKHISPCRRPNFQ
jgi:hypothetical protein